MALAILYGFSQGNFGGDGSALWALPWGRVALIDLYLGLVIFGAWIAFRERTAPRVVPWWVALITLGNFAAGLYLVWAALRSDTATQLLVGDRASS